MTEKLSPDFLNELFKTCLRSKTVLEIAINHVQYHFLPTEEYKELWKAISNHFRTLEQIPSIGSLAEQFKLKPKVIEQLRHIKEADGPAKELILTQLEIFVKKAMFLELHSDMKETYERGQYEKAIEILTKKSENIANFSLKAKAFESIFSGFENRYNTRMINNSLSQGQFLNKASFGIDSLDSRTYGGLDRGKTCLITARSGIGKSFLLRWIGYYNARMGKKVLHFQFEGSKKECTNAYDALMAGSNYHDMNLTCLSQDVVNKVIENSKKITGDIKVIAYEQFDAATMVDVRNSVIDHFKSYGDADVILVDYLDEVQPGDGIRYSASAE